MLSLVESELQKQTLVSNFKENYQRCDDLIDNVIYSLLMGHKENKIDENEVLNRITEIQDLFAENQRDLRRCI